MAPSYLQELLKKVHTCKKSQIITEIFLECPVLGTRFYGEHAFSFGGPLLWNVVPLHLKEANSVNNFIKVTFENISFPRILQLRVTIGYQVQPSFLFLS